MQEENRERITWMEQTETPYCGTVINIARPSNFGARTKSTFACESLGLSFHPSRRSG